MLDVVKKAILDLRDDIETPQFQARIDNPKDYPVLTSPEGKMMTHRMADSGNIAYPMIQLQEDGTLKDYGDNFVGAKQAALATGNYRKFDTEKEAQEYAKGGYKTEELKQFGENPPFAVQGYQQAVPEYYFEPGLQNTAPVIEATLGGLGRFVTSAIGRSKVFSDQVVDRFTRMTTPKTTYHGGPSGIGTFRTPYDRAMQGQTIKEGQITSFGDRPKKLESDKYNVGNEKTPYTPFQAGLFSGDKTLANSYAREGGSFYEIDITSAKKIYDTKKPSKFMKGELDKEIELATKTKDFNKVSQLKTLKSYVGSKEQITRVTPAQRDFLEKYDYDALKTPQYTGGKYADKQDPVVILLRPEKIKTKDLGKEGYSKVSRAQAEGKAFRKDLAKKTGAAIGATALAGGVLGSQYGKGFN